MRYVLLMRESGRHVGFSIDPGSYFEDAGGDSMDDGVNVSSVRQVGTLCSAQISVETEG